MTDNLLDQTNDQPTIDPNTDYYQLLTGPGGKFYDPDPEVAKQKLARGKYEADIHVNTIESRMDELREDFNRVNAEYQSGPKLQELLDRLSEQRPTSREQNPNSNEDLNKPNLNPDDIENLVSNKIQQHEQNRKEQENLNVVSNKLKEIYGENFKSILKEQSNALGLSDADVNLMARKNPNLFYKTFDLNAQRQTESFQTPPNSSVRPSFSPKQQKRTMSYYKELRKTNPGLYYDPKIAVQMDKDAQALGKEFFDV